MAECRRKLLLRADAQAHPSWQFPFDRRSSSRHQTLPRRAQRRAEAVRLDRLGRLDPGQARQTACTVRMSRTTSEVAAWLQELLLHCMKEKASALVDLGGGDTSLRRLLRTVPDLADVLREGGVEPVAIHVVGNNPHDLVPLDETEEAGFRPPATAIVCNERLDTRDRFGPILRHSVFRAAVERGAEQVWMPYLTRDTARLVDAKHLPFLQVGNNLGPFNGAAVRLWLKAMSQEFERIRSWLP